MLNLIKNELIKVFFNKKLHAFMLFILVVQIIPVILAFLSLIKTHEGQTYPLFFSGFIASLILPIFIALIVADLITEEYVTGTLSLTLLHPVSRIKLLTAKALSLLLIIIFGLLYSLILAYGIGTIFFGWGGEFMDRGILYTTRDGILLTLYTYLLPALPLMAFTLLIMLIALLFKSTGAVVGIAVSLIFGFALVGQLLTELRPFLITTYFNYLSVLLLHYKNVPELIRGLMVIASYGLVSYAASIFIFKKRDILH